LQTECELIHSQPLGTILVSTVSHVIAKENQIIQLVGHTVYDTGELLDIFKAINLNP